MNEIVYCGGEIDTMSNCENANIGGVRNEDGDIDVEVLVTEVGGNVMDCDSADSLSRNLDEKLKENEAIDNDEDLEEKFERRQSQSYADVSGENKANLGDFDTSLMDIPTEIDSNGVETVVFDDVMIAECCKK
uniref:Uncharacterized protein n=1 Tax=Tanacetum cinerariifolium TaxID=118510 RepID=A0A6L2NLJ2_TANCI|nr:hypothetical protein [Tanacetum cinerariifolium]